MEKLCNYDSALENRKCRQQCYQRRSWQFIALNSVFFMASSKVK